MKNRFYFSFAVVALMCLLLWPGYGQGQRSSPVRQGWEYKWVSVARSATGVGDWTIWLEDDKPLPNPVAIGRKIKEIGDQGWELVSVTPISNHPTDSSAGFTSQVTYYFKRPK